MMFRCALLVTFLLACHTAAFSPLQSNRQRCTTLHSSFTTDETTDHDNTLPPELAKITAAFQSVGDDSLRHKQLLYMANQLPPMDPKLMIPENKVPGCLSTVYIDGVAEWNSDKGEYLIHYVGESDGLLTKGLVALLVR